MAQTRRPRPSFARGRCGPRAYLDAGRATSSPIREQPAACASRRSGAPVCQLKGSTAWLHSGHSAASWTSSQSSEHVSRPFSTGSPHTTHPKPMTTSLSGRVSRGDLTTQRLTNPVAVALRLRAAYGGATLRANGQRTGRAGGRTECAQRRANGLSTRSARLAPCSARARGGAIAERRIRRQVAGTRHIHLEWRGEMG